MGQNLSDYYLYPSERERFLNALKAAHGRIFGYKIELRRKDGTAVWVSSNAHVVRDQDGKVIGVEGMTRDISTLKEAQRTLLNDKLAVDRANRAKSEFLANMSHELRTPLNAISGFSQLIAMELHGDIGDDRYLGYANDIQNSSAHLLAIINDILDLAKVEAGKLALRPQQFDLIEVMDECIKLSTSNERRAAGRITMEVPSDASVLYGDRRVCKQILINILSNAHKYTPLNGEIRIEAERGRHGATIVRIADTGVGISEDEIERILEPFGQARESIEIAHKGTGLGLSLAANLMQLHGGNLNITSKPGAGTTVALTFPAMPDVT